MLSIYDRNNQQRYHRIMQTLAKHYTAKELRRLLPDCNPGSIYNAFEPRYGLSSATVASIVKATGLAIDVFPPEPLPSTDAVSVNTLDAIKEAIDRVNVFARQHGLVVVFTIQNFIEDRLDGQLAELDGAVPTSAEAEASAS